MGLELGCMGSTDWEDKGQYSEVSSSVRAQSPACAETHSDENQNVRDGRVLPLRGQAPEEAVGVSAQA